MDLVNAVRSYVYARQKVFILAFVRISFGLLWLEGARWKEPPYFGLIQHDNLYFWMSRAIDFPVWAPYTYIVQHIILPHFLLFAWPVFIIEYTLAFGFILGVRTKFLSLIAFAMTINIALSVLNTPDEWQWSYYLMAMVSALLFAYPHPFSPLSLDSWIMRLKKRPPSL